MAAAEVLMQGRVTDPALDPEENWDDDFEFGVGSGRANPRTPPRNRKPGTSGYAQMSIGSRAETEDWDADVDANAGQKDVEGQIHLAVSSTTLRDMRTPTRPPAILSLSLAMSAQAEQETENWDDDFEYSRHSPMKVGAAAANMGESPLGKRIGSTSNSVPEDRSDAWDDDLELEADFALKHADEEDRTVTARTRRAAIAHAAARHIHPLPATPPPPTPQVPQQFSLGGPVFLAPQVPEPFPSPSLSGSGHDHASPASSVFSVPGTVRTMHSASTAPLVSSATTSGPPSAFGYPSASARVFSLLPPSPQLHRERERKERERRRLRKRSRPGERERMREREGVFELVDVQGATGSGSGRGDGQGQGRKSMDVEQGEDGAGYVRRSFDSERAFSEEEEENTQRQVDPRSGPSSTSGHSLDPHKPVVGPPRTSSTRPGTVLHAPPPSNYNTSVPATPGKQTLLGRIGSVKRWVGIGTGSGSGSGGGGIADKLQRRRGMSTGADGVYGDARHTSRPFDLQQRTPRPQSSLSSFGNYNHAASSAYSHSHSPLPHHTYPYPSRAPTESMGGNTATSGVGGWFFRASSRASSNATNPSPSPTGAMRRGFRVTTSPSTPGSPATRNRAGTSPTPSPTPATPDTRPRGKLTRSRSRSRSQAGGGTPRRSVGGAVGGGGRGDGDDAPVAVHGAALARRPSAGGRPYVPYRPPSRGGVRASMDFSASRASLGMSMSILEAEERATGADTGVGLSVAANQVGRGRGYSVGSGAPSASADAGPSTPASARLAKRKSLGFVQLRRAMGGGAAAVETESSGVDRPGGPRYGGLGLGRAFGLRGGAPGTNISKEKSPDSRDGNREEEKEERPRRKSFSRLLRRDDSSGVPKTPVKDTFTFAQTEQSDDNQERVKEEEKEGSRGFMGSVRRISLVGRHKRTKSGGPLMVPATPTPPSPSASSGFFSSGRRASGAGSNMNSNAATSKHTGPYALPPLPTSESQLSLSLRHAAASADHLPLPSTMLTAKGSGSGRRIVSTASSRSQGSSVLPPSTSSAASEAQRSAISSRNPSTSRAGEHDKDTDTDNVHQTPRQPHRTALVRRQSSSSRSRRSRVSEDDRPSLGAVGRASLDFEAQIRRSVDQERSYDIVKKATPPPPVPMPVALSLLPPIELQPPSPPQTLGHADTDSNRRTPATNMDMHYSEGKGGLSAPMQLSASLSPATSSSSLFFTPTSSPQAPAGASPSSAKIQAQNKLSPGKSPGTQQSASLGRVGAATAAAATGESEGGGAGGVDGQGGEGGKAKVLRRNSLGDLKIPARISQAQVNIKRDLGMVREFASSVEQLKEMQKIYQTLVGNVQHIFESHIRAYNTQQQASSPSQIHNPELNSAPRTISAAPGGFFAHLKPKTRARSNTNPNTTSSAAIATISTTIATTPSSSSSTAPSVSVSASASSSPQDVTTTQLAYKEMAALFWTINAKYRIPWECAELLIELGAGGSHGGESVSPASNGAAMNSGLGPHTTSVSAPFMQQVQAAVFDVPGSKSGKKTGRERAITLAGNQTTPIAKVHDPLTDNTASLMAEPPSRVPHFHGTVALPAPPPNPPPASPQGNMSWRASTGRHDLSQRQLVLLREMLNNSNAAVAVSASVSGILEGGLRSASAPGGAGASYGEEDDTHRAQGLYVNREWRWGDARNSTITLPSEDSVHQRHQQLQREQQQQDQGEEKIERKRRRGMAGFRDMLRALKRSAGVVEGTMTGTAAREGDTSAAIIQATRSTTSLSTQSSKGSKRHHYPHPRVPTGSGRRRAKTSAGPDSAGTVRASRDFDATMSSAANFVTPRASPRRPSLASIFRIGNNKNRATSMSAENLGMAPDVHDAEMDRRGQTSSGAEAGSTSEEDWDRMDSASDLDGLGRALALKTSDTDHLATVRAGSQRKAKKGRSPYLQHDSFEPPQQLLPLPVPSPSGAGYSMRHTHTVIPKRSFNASSSSLRAENSNSPHSSTHMIQRVIRLSNVEETVDEPNSPTKASHGQSAPAEPSRLLTQIGSPVSTHSMAPTVANSVRSMPLQFASSASVPLLKDAKLAMTPENIKPLLENAKEVLAKLHECIAEMQTLVAQNGVQVHRE